MEFDKIMKKRSFVVILLILAVVLTLSMTACDSIFVNKADPTRYYIDIGTVDDARTASIVANNNIASCVRVIAEYKNGSTITTSALSGFIISENGYVLTNRHGVVRFSSTSSDVPQNASDKPMSADYSVVFADNIQYKEVKLIAYSLSADLAVLKIDMPLLSNKFQPVVFETQRKLYYGERLYTIGNPENIGLVLSELTVGNPEIKLNSGDSFNSIVLDGNINHGNSGGPVFNAYSRVCGIICSRIGIDGGSTYGLSCAIPTSTIIGFLDSIKNAKINYKTTPVSTGSGEAA